MLHAISPNNNNKLKAIHPIQTIGISITHLLCDCTLKMKVYIKKCFMLFFIVCNLNLKTLLSKTSSKRILKIHNSHAHAHVKIIITKALQDCPSWFPTPSQLYKKYLRIATIIMSKIVPNSSTNSHQPWGCIHAPLVLPLKTVSKFLP
jgi:hypothetical protein